LPSPLQPCSTTRTPIPALCESCTAWGESLKLRFGAAAAQLGWDQARGELVAWLAALLRPQTTGPALPAPAPCSRLRSPMGARAYSA
jgi:hypothetical protein